MSSFDSGNSLYIGLMSGTSLDGVDGTLASFADKTGALQETLASAYIPFPDSLRAELLALQTSGPDEIHRESLAANQLVEYYAACVATLLQQAGVDADRIESIGVHGQTVRHRPDLGYTRQINNPALLAEKTGIDVIADFRSRDIAAGGQGAPLVPAFHHALFASQEEDRVVVNIGGIANISILPSKLTKPVIGFDTGPGNVLLDAWISQHNGQPYDAGGEWAKTGKVHPALLAALREEAFLSAPPPKSTGRDLFNPAWLADKLTQFPDVASADVQATLTVFSATSIADAIRQHAPDTKAVYVCGGGALNAYLMTLIHFSLKLHRADIVVSSTATLGVAPNQIEALAFAWLAQRFDTKEPANLPAVTGAEGLRILGALYPA
ncbi:anhydro-N-acetylmuramic acid kinase [Oxalicibacterium faecigallinarum]|uniref:Anhydro-N-acetylmuramic acid kinase n=1 Tax=Oxalicibacterium faecigallinarum TaxID=573741 RepID=A0A8J3F4H0_9BURK|nr:anhydro-N-acetylmuramic acid kinase [Oxalicibacterium faecigallinarum]GGI21147.1 anhydro-N-acetylmuramic acid kinase [Oxalicibacterium faecigallinarum]